MDKAYSSFVIVPNWYQPKFLHWVTDEYSVVIHTMAYYSAIKKQTIIICCNIISR